jgi:hypothetical protein
MRKGAVIMEERRGSDNALVDAATLALARLGKSG